MRTTVSIDDDVLDDIRLIAAAEGKSIGAVVSELARRALAPVAIALGDGLPVFDVPRDAQQITVADVKRALDEQ